MAFKLDDKSRFKSKLQYFCLLLVVTFETEMSKKDFNIPARLFQNILRRC
ncbi:hypothetical protein LOK49_LG07G02976 [Camellia lanceoleosa]|uniref:Uncharacterized protein n=1 Tax=Camellia lanceoleosa TaxID=1840588 RepID=A0ACC0H441_9ERIC|nr:hypothetical protein LOK49_LG07G02976 [Camellia lanceoleosa]